MKTCAECGNPIPKGRYAPTCGQDCALKRMRDEIEQMHNKSGPHYDRWLVGMRRFLKGKEQEATTR